MLGIKRPGFKFKLWLLCLDFLTLFSFNFLLCKMGLVIMAAFQGHWESQTIQCSENSLSTQHRKVFMEFSVLLWMQTWPLPRRPITLLISQEAQLTYRMHFTDNDGGGTKIQTLEGGAWAQCLSFLGNTIVAQPNQKVATQASAPASWSQCFRLCHVYYFLLW